MAIRIEVDGTDRTSGANSTRQSSIRISRRLQGMGVLSATLQSTDATWRPARYDPLEMWEPVRVVTDGAITATDGTLESAAADFVDDDYPDGDVGAHVRVAGAGVDGADLYTTIVSVTDEGEVELEDVASTTVSGAQVLIGRSRFRGVLASLKESRIGTRSTSSEFPVTAQDLVVALRTLYPRGAYAAQSLLDRVTALLDDTGADTWGIVLSWPVYDIAIRDTDSLDITDTDGATIYECAANQEGAQLSATTYTGRLTLADVLDSLMVEHLLGGGTARAWKVDTLGRLRVDPISALALPQSLTSADIKIDGLSVDRVQEPYRNRQVLYYGEGLSDYVVVDNTSEITALGGRIIEHVAEDADITTEAEAEEAADTLLADNGDSDKHTSRLTVIDVEGIELGQSGTITLAERGLSGDHLVQAVESEYVGWPALTWRYRLTTASGSARNVEWLDYFAGLQQSSGLSSSGSGSSPVLSGDLLALEQLTGTGFARRTGDSAWTLDTPTQARSTLDLATTSTPEFAGLGIGTAAGSSGLKLVEGSAIYPSADSTSALKITKADGSTVVVTIDTTNKRVGIGVTPSYLLHIEGSSIHEYFTFSYGGSNRWRWGSEFMDDSSNGRRFIFFNEGRGDYALICSQYNNIGINFTGTDWFGTNAQAVFAITNGVAPTSSPANMFQMYSADVSSSAVPHFRTEAGNVIKLYKTGTYTPTNVTTDRSYNADSTSTAELADVLGTLIADLQLLGVIG